MHHLNNKETIRNSRNTAKIVWCIAPEQNISLRYWDGDSVVFSPLSGQTHILDIASGRVLKRITDQPATVEDIRSELAVFLEVENDAELAKAVEKILSRLEDAGLIEPEM